MLNEFNNTTFQVSYFVIYITCTIMQTSTCPVIINLIYDYAPFEKRGHIALHLSVDISVSLNLVPPVRARAVKSRMCPPYPQRVVKGD